MCFNTTFVTTSSWLTLYLSRSISMTSGVLWRLETLRLVGLPYGGMNLLL